VLESSVVPGHYSVAMEIGLIQDEYTSEVLPLVVPPTMLVSGPLQPWPEAMAGLPPEPVVDS